MSLAKIEIDGSVYELVSGLLAIVNCAAQGRRFLPPAHGPQEHVWWLSGIVEPAPQTLDVLESSTFRASAASVNELLSGLTGQEQTVKQASPDGLFVRDQREGPTAFRLSASFDLVDGNANSRMVVFDLLANFVWLHEGARA